MCPWDIMGQDEIPSGRPMIHWFINACTSIQWLVLPCFLANFYIVGNKIPKTTRIFNDVDHPKSQGVMYWAKRIGAIQKNHMLFLEYFKIGCMYLNSFLKIWKVWSGAMLVTIFHTITSITPFYVIKKPKKSQKKKPSWAKATLQMTNNYIESKFAKEVSDVKNKLFSELASTVKVTLCAAGSKEYTNHTIMLQELKASNVQAQLWLKGVAWAWLLMVQAFKMSRLSPSP